MTTPFTALPGIDLETLDTSWAFQTRVDRKYVVDASILDELADDLEPGTTVLEIDGRTGFQYRSVYFDTPDLRTYRDAAHRRSKRFKVRTRTYVDSDLLRLEVKTKDGRGRTVKHRKAKSGDPRELTSADRGFLGCHIKDLDTVNHLRASLVNSYRRTTLALPGREARATIDTGLAFWTPDQAPWSADHIAIIETKAGHHPSAIDRWLWSRHIRPVRMSKYCTTLALLRPELPANKWHPVISRYFADSSPSGAAMSLSFG